MLKSIIENGSPAQKQFAMDAYMSSARLRGQRQALAEAATAVAFLGLQAEGGKYRLVYTADNSTTLPGRLLREEGGSPTGDVAADEAYDGAGATYDLYWEVYQRNSLDGNGMRLISTVHYGKGYDNAFWDGKQMAYGDGDEDLPSAERLFNRFTIAIDVMGHELTHGVTQFESNLTYWGQSGALNESLSDVFGSLVKQRVLGQTVDQADWIIGAGLFTSNVHGVGIRSMKAPGTAYDDPVLGKDPQPAHMSDYVNTVEDNGGVHINSGIPNHAFYVAAVEMGGYAWEKAGRIWYVAARDKFTKSTNFQSAAELTYQTAGELYGEGSLEQQAVRKGWQAVGIDAGGATSGGCLGVFATFLRSLVR
ncbi:MAG: M4 family metallopeptidase [Anaerolineae bacterium]